MPKYDRWFEMETAPRDGRTVLLIFKGGNVADAWYSKSDNPISKGKWDLNGQGWCYEDDPIGWLPRDALPSTANAPATPPA